MRQGVNLDRNPVKKCTQCGQVKPLSEFYKNSSQRDGRTAACKACVAELSRRYYENNKEKIAEGMRRHYENNKEKMVERARRYREGNKEKIAARARRWREENKEKVAEYSRRYCGENKKKVAESTRRYYENNKEKIAEGMRRYCENNKEKIAEIKRRHYENNKEKIAERKRRHRKNLTDPYIKGLLRQQGISNPPAELVEIKRQQVIAKRLLQQMKEENYEPDCINDETKQRENESTSEWHDEA